MVEHDEEATREADHVIDLGPVRASRGILLLKVLQKMIENEKSLTGHSLRRKVYPFHRKGEIKE